MADEFGDEAHLNALLQAEQSAPPKPRNTLSSSTAPRQPTPKVQQPKPQALPPKHAPSAILVSKRQKGNPILSYIKILPWEYADIPADYVLGNTTCALFLSLKYHRLHPEYIYSRIRGIAGKYRLRILLIIVDIPNHEDNLKELSKTSIINNLTLMLCWSATEAAHYLELFKASENAQPTAIRTQQAQSYKDSLTDFVTMPRSINKSDAASLISTFGSLQNAINAQPEQISAVPGWGERKVRQWCNAVREDFRIETAKGTKAPERDAGAMRALEDRTVTRDEEEVMRAVNAGEMRADMPGEAENARDARPRDAGEDEGVSEGITAALAKLREGGS
ncbi:DNA repair protein RAD10 [Aspergillus chevalieri]|uniref:SsDNA endonuclease and repair protein rad10 n=1 Tax=Aspergillus chevalieri TaxID=182096 RepID=A0A7R7VHN6_ASPCH|nr:ssDNA endonuclease and repair protein rad10 [Aspergillus chevalieri]BCR84916.1 ssDNA endonuclease and repair protein rad10 [Aspergillus chevalieri]